MIEYVHQMNRNYVKITKEEANEINYGIRMVENNKIEGLLPLKIVDINNKFSCLYDISGQISLEEKYETTEFSGEDVAYIIEFIKNMISRMESYMLDLDGIIFNPKYVFCDVGTGAWNLIYGYSELGGARSGLRELFEFILERLNHKDQTAVVSGYGLYKRVCREEIPIDRLFDGTGELAQFITSKDNGLEFSLNEKKNSTVMPARMEEQKEILRQATPAGLKISDKKIFLYGTVAGAICLLLTFIFFMVPSISKFRAGEAMIGQVVMAAMVTLVFMGMVGFGVFMYMNTNPQPVIVTEPVEVPCVISNPVVYATSPVGVSKEPVYTDKQEERTMLLSATPRTKIRLLSKNRGGDVEYDIVDTPVSLGSGNQADILLEYEGISRIHARISKEGSMLFIKDMNSTNGTWVNERQLSIYELCPIKDGDIIRLAATSFEIIDTIG